VTAVAPHGRPAHSSRAASVTFLLILLGHIGLGTAYGLNEPLFESPDEQGHYLFVRWLQNHGTLPVQTTNFDAARAHHPPGYFLLGALVSGWVSVEGAPDAIHMQPNPKFAFRPTDPFNDNKAVYIHNGPEERFPFAGQARVVHLVRLVSLLFSSLAVVFAYLTAHQTRPGDAALALLAAGLVAFNPMVLFMSGLVNNDTAALATGAALVYLLARFNRAGFSPARWAMVGAAWGIGLLLKSSALVLAAPIGVALLLETWRARQPLRLLTHGAALGLPPLLMAGWWFERNLRLYGDLTGNAAVAMAGGRLLPEERFVGLPGNIAWLFKGIVGCGPLGPFSLCYPAWVYTVAVVFCLVAAAGLVKSIVHQPAVIRAEDRQLWLIHGVTVLAVFGAMLVYATTLRNAWSGRLLFPAYASAALLLSAGVLHWIRPHWRAPAVGVIVALSAALSAYGLWGLVLPRYGLPRSPSATELKQAVPVGAELGGVARVLAYRLDSTTVQAGGMLAVTVYWQALERTTAPYTVFVQLAAPGYGVIAQRDTYPGLGNYATTVWDPGRVFADTYRVFLPPDAPLIDQASLLVGLYDAETGERLLVTSPGSTPSGSDWVQFGGITVIAGPR
jgi:4-amino-4-deoxy-L-arabinose transferase-like glycosyltransferase